MIKIDWRVMKNNKYQTYTCIYIIDLIILIQHIGRTNGGKYVERTIRYDYGTYIL